MKKVFSFIFFIVSSLAPSVAQDEHGFLNFVSIIPGDQVCQIRINSKNPAADGLKSSDDTGWFMYPVGSASLTITCGHLKEAKETLQIKKDVGSLVAIFLEADPKPTRDGEPAPPVLRIRSFPTYEAEGHALRFASLCSEDNHFQLDSLRIELKQFEIAKIPNWSGAAFKIKKNGKDIAKIPAMREEEPHYLLIGTDLEGDFASALVFGGTVKAPPWRQRKPKNEEGKP